MKRGQRRRRKRSREFQAIKEFLMHYFRSLGVLLGLLCLCAPARAETYRLEQAVVHALKVNPAVESKVLLLEQARMNVGVAQSFFWPRVSLVAGTNAVENFNAVNTYSADDLTSQSWTQGVRLQWSLFAGFAHLNNLEKSRLSVDMERARARQARLELGVNVQLQFLQLLKSREDLKSAEESVSRIKTQLKAAEEFVKVGMAPYLNVLQNKVDLAKAQQQVIRVRNDIRNAEVQLNKYLGYPPEQHIVYKGDLRDFSGVVSASEAEAIQEALRRRPDLEIARKAVAVALKDMHIALGEYLPRVDATYDNMRFSRDYEDEHYTDYTRRYWSVGLNFSWDAFTGGSTTFTVLGDKKRAQSLRKEYEDALSGARTDVIRSLLDIQAARELIGTSRAGVDAARESYAMANKRYMTNTGTITDLLDAQLKLTEAENDASRALAEYHSARARFFYHIGRENPGLK